MSKSQLGMPWQEIISVLEFKNKDVIAMLHRGYIDDSADQKQEVAVVAGALLASVKDWKDFPQKWNKRLKRDGFEYFRSSEYSNLSGEFSRFRDPVKYPKPAGSEAARTLRNDLDAIVTSSPIIGIAVVIPVKIYKEFRDTVPGAAAKFGEQSYPLALQTVFMECAYVMRDEFPGENNLIGYVCDDSSNAPLYSQVYVDFKAKNPIISQVMRGMVHLDDKKQPRLQAADMMANVSKEIAVKYLNTADAALLRNEDRTYYGASVALPRLQGCVYRVYILSWDFLHKLLEVQD